MKDVKIFIIIIFIFQTIRKFDCEIYSSIDKLEKLAYDERKLLDEFSIFASKVKNENVDKYANY